MCTYSSTSIASCTSRSVSYRQRRIWHSSNIWLRLMSCLDLELEACVQARKPCWAAYLDVIDITFYAHRPKGALESRLSIIPRSDGTFPAIKLDD
jgi:hypothetical protein